MPSQLQGFSYDIFISYRQNDNRSGWITAFVNHLQEELSAAVKEPVSVYFDANPHDGLLETHSVDKSLEGKLNCVIFLPILSQTYCDQGSFAWQHELCAFNSRAQQSDLTREIKLGNGNVASRILPIRIHDLDDRDTATIEKEIGGALRAIDFIYREPGVNRPLKPGDDRNVNQNHTDYRNQVNKVANAIKEILRAIKSPDDKSGTAFNEVFKADAGKATSRRAESKGITWRRAGVIAALIALVVIGAAYILKNGWLKSGVAGTRSVDDASIAVLPFTDMSPLHDQEYLGDGVAERIITALSKIKDLKVIGRTSSFQFKGQHVDLRDVGETLDVSTVLEGSIMKSEGRIRVTAQLIDVESGAHIWSEQYDRETKDIFLIQDEIAQLITQKMKATLSMDSPMVLTTTSNFESYENFLLGNQLLVDGPINGEKAIPYFEQAIKIDPGNTDAYLGLGLCYFFLPIIGKMSAEESFAKVTEAANKAMALAPTDPRPHLLLFNANHHHSWDWAAAEEEYRKAVELSAPNEINEIGHSLYRLLAYNDVAGCVEELKAFLKLNPLQKDGLRALCMVHVLTRNLTEARKVANRLIEIDPHYPLGHIFLADISCYENKFDEAREHASAAVREDAANSQQRSFFDVKILALEGKLSEARKLMSSIDINALPPADAARLCIYVGEKEKAFEFLNRALIMHQPALLLIRVDGDFEGVRREPGYQEIVGRVKFPG